MERMPSFTSLVSNQSQKRQRRLKFETCSDQENSSQGFSNNQSPSASYSQQSNSNAAHPSQPESPTATLSQSGDRAEDPYSPDDIASGREPSPAAVADDRHQTTQVRSSSRYPSAALPALAAAMGSHAPNAARSAASHVAATAAALTPVTSRYVSSQSGVG